MKPLEAVGSSDTGPLRNFCECGGRVGKTSISFFQRCSPTLAPPHPIVAVASMFPADILGKMYFQSFECRYYSANTAHLQSVPDFAPSAPIRHGLDAVNALADISRIHFRPKPSLSLTAVQSFSSSFFLLPYA